MNEDDRLDDALRALRDVTDGRSERAPRTRARIVAQAVARARTRRRAVVLAAPLAAVLVASTAWAAATGRLPRVWELLVARRAETTAAPPSRTTATAPSSSSSSSPRVAEDAAAEEAPVASVAPPPAPLPSPATPGASSPSSAPVAAPRARLAAAASASASISAAEQELYDRAHKAHFVDRDPAAALRGWDAYLAAYPHGALALEARYNRAIALVRLGRRDEAREALAPFADGSFGGYRRREARGLLDALEADAAP